MLEVIQQTQYLSTGDFTQFLTSILQQISHVGNIEKMATEVSHLISFVIQIMKLNADRIEQSWNLICPILKLTLKEEQLGPDHVALKSYQQET